MKELIEIQSKLKAPKGQYNKFGNYKYRSCEDILEAVKPLLYATKCHLTITDSIMEVGSTVIVGDKVVTSRIYVQATATLVNDKGESVSATAYAREDENLKGMTGSQITGAASSYARKYALNGLFCIDDTKDSDATNNGETKENDYWPMAMQEINGAQTTQELGAIYNRYKGVVEEKKLVNACANKKNLIKQVC